MIKTIKTVHADGKVITDFYLEDGGAFVNHDLKFIQKLHHTEMYSGQLTLSCTCL